MIPLVKCSYCLLMKYDFTCLQFFFFFSLFPTQSTAAAAKSLQSCPTLCDPIDGSPLGSPIPGILQARTLEWFAISFSNTWKWSHSVVSDSSQSHGNYPAPNSDPSLLASTELYKDVLINLFGAHWKFTSTWLLLGSISHALLPPVPSMGISPRPHCLFHPYVHFPWAVHALSNMTAPSAGFYHLFLFYPASSSSYVHQGN